jgi:hypothetical protein
VVLRTKNLNLDLAAFDQLRATKYLGEAAVIQFGRPAVQVHGTSWSIGLRERCCCRGMILWAHVQVEIPIGAERRVGVQLCYGPPLSQQRIQSNPFKKASELREVAIMDGGLKGMHPIRLLKLAHERRRAGIEVV